MTKLPRGGFDIPVPATAATALRHANFLSRAGKTPEKEAELYNAAVKTAVELEEIVKGHTAAKKQGMRFPIMRWRRR